MHKITGPAEGAGFSPDSEHLMSAGPPAQWQHSPGPEKSRADEHIAVKLYDILHRRTAFFGDGMFSDPAWAILLKLFIAQKAHQPVQIAQVREAAGIPAAAATRWMKILVQNGHVKQQGDSEDTTFTLTARASRTLAALLAEFEDRQA